MTTITITLHAPATGKSAFHIKAECSKDDPPQMREAAKVIVAMVNEYLADMLKPVETIEDRTESQDAIKAFRKRHGLDQ